MMSRTKAIWIGVPVVILFVLLGAEERYIASQPLQPPGTVELGGLIQAAGAVTTDLENCVLAGKQTGWTGYQDYVGFSQAGQQKLDVIAQDEGLAIGGDVLKNCQSIEISFFTGEGYAGLRILNRFNRIWFKVEQY